jgi:aryl-alcohol dehydrogenase-like predicted oxidoreductase
VVPTDGEARVSQDAPQDFRFRTPPVLGKRVYRLGLAASQGIDEAAVRGALDAGVNYLFFTRKSMHGPVREAVRRDRDRLVIACGPVLGYFPGSIRRATEKVLRTLGTDYLDVLQIFWLGKMSAFTEGNVEEMVRLREEGKVRALGVSIHDRPRAGRLAEDSPLDLLMIRYNAAHPGAESDIFPHLARRQPAVVAYTATCWRKLLSPPKGWQGPAATAGDCYRFSLTSPHVDVVLTAPASAAQLRENMQALERGPLLPDEEARMRALGRAVHG